MIRKPIETNLASTFSYLSENCKTLNQLKQAHAHILKSHLPRDHPIAIAPLLSLAATSNNSDSSFFSYALAVFQHLQYRNTFVYNTMIRGFLNNHSPVSAVSCYIDMLRFDLRPNKFTYPPLIKACSVVVGSKLLGCSVHGQVVVTGYWDDPFVVSLLIEFYSVNLEMRDAHKLFDGIPDRDVVLWTNLIDGYGKNEDIGNARALFDEMPDKCVITWSVIMAAYSRVNDYEEVISLYARMQESGLKPNESILVSVLTACAHLGALAQGLWIHSYAKRCNFLSNPILATALVDMYSKCGSTELALSVFEDIPEKDNGAWNAIISGMAMNGQARRALQLFDKMSSDRIQPTEATFVALLAACTHARLVKEGLELFEQMEAIYGVEPQSEHYACVVDLYARAGMLEEAERFVEEKFGEIGKADANVWGALLSACRNYENVEIGNRVWKKLADTGVAAYGSYLLSYNIYKDAGWKSEAKGVRDSISDSGMKKMPGCSMIEVDGEVNEFVAGDLSHPKAQEVCKALESLFNIADSMVETNQKL